jgi:hypothetical protein
LRLGRATYTPVILLFSTPFFLFVALYRHVYGVVGSGFLHEVDGVEEDAQSVEAVQEAPEAERHAERHRGVEDRVMDVILPVQLAETKGIYS